ncbi:MAG: hypothetical protein ABIH57_02340 [Candidatus Omnitrophota bacterium]
MISFDQFKTMEICVAKVISVEDHPNADKLYVVTVDTGSQTKKVVAGLKMHYSIEELSGKSVVFLNNLEPAVIRGVESEGMILATKDQEKLAILIPEKEVSIGSPIS